LYNNQIPSGLGFFVQGDVAAGTVSITENSKAASASAGNVLAFRPAFANAQLRTNLYIVEANGNFLVDGVLSQFADKYSNVVDKYDAIKIRNFAENLSVKPDSLLLAIERRQTIAHHDTIHLNMLKMKAKPYRFEFIGQNFDPALTAFLEDGYYNTRIPIDINGASTYNFDVVNIPGSWNPERFRIVFALAEGGPLPITFSAIKAYEQNGDITVKWTVDNEKNIKQYEVEKSSDGIHFNKATVVIAKLNNSGSVNYEWLDINPFVGTNYYRIKSTDIKEDIQYSSIVRIAINQDRPQIIIYPNPSTNGNVNLQLINQPKGAYAVRLIDELGQVIIVKQIDHRGGSRTENLPVNKNMAHGNYHIEVTKPDYTKLNIKILY
jgi:hypothetical protein